VVPAALLTSVENELLFDASEDKAEEPDTTGDYHF
jgi:hypothetical protein